MENKQIEEMVKIIKEQLYEGKMADEFANKLARRLVNYYQPKLPENTVVLTREEYEEFNHKIHELRKQNVILNNQLAEMEADFK